MVIRNHSPGKQRMSALEIRIRFIKSVAKAILLQVLRLFDRMMSDASGISGTLVDVIAEMYDEVQVFFSHVLIRGVVSVFVVLTRSERESELIDTGAGGGSRTSSADATGHPILSLTDKELIPIPGARPKLADFGVYGVRQFRRCYCGTTLYDVSHLFVSSYLPVHGHRFRRHPTAI